MKPWAAFGGAFSIACSGEPTALISQSDLSGDALVTPLTQLPGDAERGRTIFADRDTGHCVLCHVVDELDVEFQGNVGPDLSWVGDRLSAGQLRLRIVDYQLVTPGALMPSYYRTHDLYQVGDAFQDETILTAEQVEDLVAYLGQLKKADADNDS